MREVVIISGKGGTGKTTLSASFAYLAGDKAIISDCDVDAANMHLLLDANFKKQEDFFSGELAVIDEEICTNCGNCFDVCRFDAIYVKDNQHYIDKISCEGCHYCSRVCKQEAITMQTQKIGDIYVSDIKNNSTMVHAKLGFGAENSGKLVAKVKQKAKLMALQKNRDYVITDGSPGVGCPVISSLSGANLVLLVTEATVSGLHDLKRVLQVVNNFKLKAVCIINKYDLNKKMSQEIENFLKVENIELISKLPYDETFTKALAKTQTILEFDKNSQLANLVTQSWIKIKEQLK